MTEILIIGCGGNIEPVDPELRRFIRSTGMKLEAVDTVHYYSLPLFVSDVIFSSSSVVPQ